MTEEIMTTELFKMNPIRIVMHEGVQMIPVVDIAAALKYDRGNMTRMLDKNNDLFGRYKAKVRVMTPGGEQDLVCLSDYGIVGVLFKINYSQVNDKELRQKVLEFQIWAIETLTNIRKIAAIAGPEQDLLSKVSGHLDVADMISKRCGIPKAVAHSMALSIDSDASLVCAYASFLKNQKPELPGVDSTVGPTREEIAEYEKHFTLTQIADFAKISTKTARQFLEEEKIICYERGNWYLTIYGEKFGKTFKVRPGYPFSAMERPFVKYNNLAVELLRQKVLKL